MQSTASLTSVPTRSPAWERDVTEELRCGERCLNHGGRVYMGSEFTWGQSSHGLRSSLFAYACTVGRVSIA